ncbi:hypothetical protein CERZMDRAFT_120200 [Cercospora zeae-maydis SCOH1-5]|uniref:Kinesin-like protein n=1 Tax=Cercospora zeae-maydis SCOH1-5 TaxID=717836 RepID=A0A6A6FP77_9PEZI|nr:hypothetical protein CERZMDRAFT_120200 [Cercospora zeae-maydis SCOH1-5]
MEALENTRPSGLKPPSKLPAFAATRALQETTLSEQNARAADGASGTGSAMRPPSSIVPSKHKVSNLPEPPLKRKTLAERAGEPANTLRNKPSISTGFGTRPTTSGTNSYRAPANIGSTTGSLRGLRPPSRQANGFGPGTRTNSNYSTTKTSAAQYDEDDDGDGTLSASRKGGWDTVDRLDHMERMFQKLKGEMDSANGAKDSIETSLEIFKTRCAELEREKNELKSELKISSTDLDRTRNELHTTSTDLRQVRRDHEREMLDVERKHERDLADLRLKQEKQEIQFERERERSADKFRREMEEARRTWERQQSDKEADLTSQSWEEMAQLRADHEKEKAALQKELDELRQAGESRATESASEVQQLRDTTADLQKQLEASRATEITLRSRISAFEARIAALEQERNTLVSKAHFLEGNQEAQSLEFTNMRGKLEEAIAQKDAVVETLRKEEALRRKLNNTILELRGNIRVFVRTRPLLNGEDDPAKVEYLEQDSLEGCKEMVVHAPASQSAMGTARNEKHNYAFDRVFTPGTPNENVFAECQDLIQSVVDGYNVSILSYGQTGSGKTYGMTGPSGIIPSAIRMLLSEMRRLRTKGWEYAVEANFVEVYNETLNDLLGDAKCWDEGDGAGASARGKTKEKHEIHHDPVTGKTSVSNLTTIGLWPPPMDEGSWPPAASIDGGKVDSSADSYTEKAVNNLLDTAAKNRRVAATKANERSSRSHSVFILTLKGSCAATSEVSEGVLNLVDLAGSERLKQSGAEGSRRKETQAINKSLSSLGDVIAALGNKTSSEAHVPYRNSKLTYLLQSSLGGSTAGKSSRTLMLLHLSPLQAHWQESKSSLNFGSKVHGTHIGSAKKR